MRKLVAVLLLCGVVCAAYAVPAKRGWQTRIQADGTTIEVQQVGDEFYHYTINRDGQQVREVDGMYEVVGEAPSAEVAKARHAAAKAKRARKATNAEFGYTPYLPPKGVVIMVNFKDKSFQSSTTKAVIDELCNSENCTVNKYNGVNYGSIGQYFRDQSDGQYNLQLDVYGPVTLDNNYSYYGQDYQKEGNDKYSGNVIIEACKKMDSKIDFSQYDWNNDGDVDFVYVVYAGKGQADGGDDNTIWPHSYDIESSRYYGNCTYQENQCKFDGKRVQSYAMSNELSGSSLAGIGIICHEYGHVIGLPDHYDTDYGDNYNNSLTPNEWDVMDGGSYNGEIHCPPNYNAWEKAFCGWYTPENLGNEGRKVEMKPIGTDGYSAYQINASGTQQAVTTNGSTNYYIECRQKQGWDKFLPAAGMLIWKVNYIKSYWIDNEPNLSSHGDPHFTLVIPSGTEIGEGYGSQNVWPYSTKTSWSGVSGKPLKDITQSGNNITLTYIEEPVIPIDPFDVVFKANGKDFKTESSTGKLVLPATDPEACNDGRVFVGWCSQADYSNPTTAPAFAKAGDAVEEGATFYAVFATQEGEGGTPTWDLVSNASSLKAGDVLVMACESEGFTAGDISSQIMASVESTFSNNQITSLGAGTVELTLGGSEGVWTLSSTSGLLGATDVKKLAWGSGTTTWSISISDSNATIQSTTDGYGRFLYNVNSPRFTTYTSKATSAMLLPQLYRKTGGGASYSDYSTVCSSETGVDCVEEVKDVQKFLYNGQLIIQRGNAKYNTLGIRIE